MASNVPGAVGTLLDAANHHDTEALLASFTQDGVVDDWGREFTGAESIRGWSDREFIRGERQPDDYPRLDCR
jgi:hypothetical protein